jgi:hypothetical protein
MGIPSLASLAYRGGAVLNFAIAGFSEVRLSMAKATMQAYKQKPKQKN